MEGEDVEQHIGSLVSADCGACGVFQGRISSVHVRQQTVTLDRPYRDGKLMNEPFITLRADDIHDLKVVKLSSEFEEAELLRVPRVKRQAPQKKISPKNAHNGYRPHSEPPCASFERRSRSELKDGDRALAAPLDLEILEEDFDFEANLALFDKTAVRKELDQSKGPRDVTKMNFRHDENILKDAARVTSWIQNGTKNNTTCPISPVISKSSSVACLVREKKELLFEELAGSQDDAFLVANASRGILDCLLLLRPNTFLPQENGPRSRSPPIGVGRCVILSGKSPMSQAVARQLAIHLLNRLPSSAPPLALFCPPSPAFHPKVQLICNDKVPSLPRCRDTSLVISLLDFPFKTRLDPLLADWIRSVSASVLAVETWEEELGARGDWISCFWDCPIAPVPEGQFAVFDLGVPFDRVESVAGDLNLSRVFRNATSVLVSNG